MYAIVDIAGQQLKVTKDQKLFVHRLEGETGSKKTFDKVLLIDNDSKVTVGSPSISGATVSATVIEHLKGDKVLVFKKKRRKGYQKLNGHRQYLSRIQITDILEKGAKAPLAKKEVVKQTSSAKATEAKPTAIKAKPAATAAKAKPTAAKKTSSAKATEAKPAPKAKSASATKKPAAKAKPAASAAKAKPTAAKKPSSAKTSEDKKAGDKK